MAVLSKPTNPMYVRVEETARPELNPEFLEKEEPDEVRRTVIEVGYTLLHDIDLFKIVHLLKHEARDTIFFVRAAHFYGEILISSPDYMSDISSDDPTASDLQKQVGTVIKDVRKGLEELDKAIVKAGWKLDVTTLHHAPLVPTACPHQLLIEAIVKRGEVAAALSRSRDDKDLIRNIKNYLPDLLSKPPKSNKKWIKDGTGNGRPLTTFISAYHQNIDIWAFHKEIGRRILVGCSKPNLKGFYAFAGLAMYLRKVRLSNIIPLCDEAFNALKSSENQHLERIKQDKTKTKEQCLWEARKAAWVEMKEHHAFLGGTDEVGAAFNGNWNLKAACYLCDSTMGYQELTPIPESERQTTFKAFN